MLSGLTNQSAPHPGILINSVWFTAVKRSWAANGIFFRDAIDCSSLSSEHSFQLCRQQQGEGRDRGGLSKLSGIRIDSLISLRACELSLRHGQVCSRKERRWLFERSIDYLYKFCMWPKDG